MEVAGETGFRANNTHNRIGDDKCGSCYSNALHNYDVLCTKSCGIPLLVWWLALLDPIWKWLQHK